MAPPSSFIGDQSINLFISPQKKITCSSSGWGPIYIFYYVFLTMLADTKHRVDHHGANDRFNIVGYWCKFSTCRHHYTYEVKKLHIIKNIIFNVIFIFITFYNRVIPEVGMMFQFERALERAI
jgi:hypothetical protein